MPTEFGRPRGPETIRIEGSEVKAMRETTIDQVDQTDLFDIDWEDQRAGLRVTKVGIYHKKVYGEEVRYPLYELTAWHYNSTQAKNVPVNLSDKVTTRKKTLFTGSRSGFFMHDPAWAGIDTDYYVVGVNPFELRDDIRKNAATFHELGHALIVDRRLDLRLFRSALHPEAIALPPVAMAAAYRALLRVALLGGGSLEALKEAQGISRVDSRVQFELMNENREFDAAMRVFHERNAWAAAMHLFRKYAFPSGYEHSKSLETYAQFCLETYRRAFGEKKFTKGLRGWTNSQNQHPST